MRFKLFLTIILAAFVFSSARLSHSQSAAAAQQKGLQLNVGAGFSGFNPDYRHGHLMGGTLWIDYSPSWIPRRLSGLGIEAEGRDLSMGRSASQPANLREDVASGGVLYTWRHFRNFRPYGKFLLGYGNTDYEYSSLARHHDSRTVTTLGGGFEAPAYRNIWLRVDYEYQRWPDFFFNGTTPIATLNPQGFTVGASYHFGGRQTH